MATIIPVISAVLASGGLWSVILYRAEQRVARRNDRKAADSVERAALVALLHAHIVERCTALIAAGECSPEELDDVITLYKPYAAMGGNGTGKKLMTEVEALPTKTEGKI